MKKIVITIAAVVFAAVAAQAQSPSAEVRVADAGLGRTFANSKQTSRMEQAVTRKVTQAAKKASQNQSQTQTSKNTSDTPAQAKPAKPAKSAPAKTAPKTTPSKKNTGEATTAKQGQKASFGQWLQAIFLGGKFPDETDDQYHARLLAQSQPASLPFK